jgi:hypothetical protein
MNAVRQSPHHPPRPGERREPLLVRFENAAQALFMGECQTARVAPARAYALLLERRLLLDDLAEVGLRGTEAALDGVALSVTPELALDGASSAYLRSFIRPAVQTSVVATLLVPVPVRLYARARELAPATTIESGAVEQAIRWERASVLEGRTMAEWAFVSLLATRTLSGDVTIPAGCR